MIPWPWYPIVMSQGLGCRFCAFYSQFLVAIGVAALVLDVVGVEMVVVEVQVAEGLLEGPLAWQG